MDLRGNKGCVEVDARKRPRRPRVRHEDRQICGNARHPAARGSTLTEFAFILPVMLMCLFGVIDFGRALYTYHFVSNAAREASRWASVRGNTCTDYPDCPARPPQVSDYVMSIVPSGIDKKTVSVATDSVQSGGAVNSCLKDYDPGCAVKVTVTYNFKFFFPFLPTSALRMHSTSQMVISK